VIVQGLGDKRGSSCVKGSVRRRVGNDEDGRFEQMKIEVQESG